MTQRAADDDVLHSVVHAARDRARHRLGRLQRVRVAGPVAGKTVPLRDTQVETTRTTGPEFPADPPELRPHTYACAHAKAAKAACADVARLLLLLRNGLELDHLRSGKCDAQHLGSEVHEHCRIAVLGADHGTEAVPIMADSIADGVARHNSDGWRLVEGTSWEGPRGAGAERSHASNVRPTASRRCAIAQSSGLQQSNGDGFRCGLQSGSSHPILERRRSFWVLSKTN